MEIVDNTFSKKIDNAEPVKADSTNSLVSALDKKAGKCEFACQFSLKNYQIADIVSNLDQITNVAYLLQEVQDEH